MKSMILAAGLGTRLRPITTHTPKALIMLQGRPLILYPLLLLRKHGITDVLINLHYLGDLIEKELGDGKKLGMHISYSWESTLLGTGGGIRKGKSFFKNESFLVLNSDVLMDLDLKKLIGFHHKKKGIATMVVRPRPSGSGFTPVTVTHSNFVETIGNAHPEDLSSFMYTGTQVIEPQLLDYLPPFQECCIVRQGYRPALEDKKKVAAYRYDGYWNDLGTLESYRKAEQELESGKVKFSYLL